jgi:ketosteroid isomerase-like protein
MKLLRLALMTLAFGAMAQAHADERAPNFQDLYLQWLTAFDKGDGPAMNAMELPDLIVVNTNGSGNIVKKTGPRTKSKGQDVTRHTLSSATVRQYGDTAILTALDTVTSPGAPDDVAATTVVWIRQNGKWLVAVAQWSAVPATAASK